MNDFQSLFMSPGAMNLLIQLFHMFWAPSAVAGPPHLKRHLGLERRWLVGGNQRAAKHWLDFKLRYDSSARTRAQLYRLTFHKSIIRKSFWSWADELTAATFQRVHQVAQSCRAPHTSLLTWSYRVCRITMIEKEFLYYWVSCHSHVASSWTKLNFLLVTV